MPDSTVKALEAYGSAFRWGHGLLGKSAIVVGPLAIGLLVLAWECHSDLARGGFALLAVCTFFGWYIPFMRFCEKHPADALLEGTHWVQHQQSIIAVKGQSRLPDDTTLKAPVAGISIPPSVRDNVGERKS